MWEVSFLYTKILIPDWLANQKGITGQLIGYIKKETEKAVLFCGVALPKHSIKCLRCGRRLKEKDVRKYGIGKGCQKRWRVDQNSSWDVQYKQLSKRLPTVTVWVPKKSITYIK